MLKTFVLLLSSVVCLQGVAQSRREHVPTPAPLAEARSVKTVRLAVSLKLETVGIGGARNKRSLNSVVNAELGKPVLVGGRSRDVCHETVGDESVRACAKKSFQVYAHLDDFQNDVAFVRISTVDGEVHSVEGSKFKEFASLQVHRGAKVRSENPGHYELELAYLDDKGRN